MGFEFSDRIKRGGASCCEVACMGCEFKIILKDDTQYFQSFTSGNTRYLVMEKEGQIGVEGGK